MSAIVGIHYVDGRPVERIDLDRMVDSLAHRGPDGAGVWLAGAVGLGHRMLWSTPESHHEHLPLHSRAGDCILTADARIDNRGELIAALDLTDRAPGEIGDGELILAAYERWGERCAEKLLGDFVFAIWDGRNRGLFCARDSFGVKPFYYYRAPGGAFAFASEIKALLCLPQVPRRLNEVRVAEYLTGIVEDQAATFYQDILRLPPGHCLLVSRERTRLWQYWSLDPRAELRLGSDEDYAEAFRAIFAEAVRCRLRSTFPVGAMLSGGLDSSSIVCVARGLVGAAPKRHLHTFSAIFPGLPPEDLAEIDERHYIEAVLAAGEIEPYYVQADQLSPLGDIDRILWHQDQPFVAPNLFLNWGLHGAARQAGARVLLDGFGGDSTVSHGGVYLTELMHTGQWDTLASEVVALGQRFDVPPERYVEVYGLPYLGRLAREGRWVTFARAAHQISRRFHLSRRDLYLHHGLKPLAPQWLRRARGALHRSAYADDEGAAILNRRFARRIRLDRRLHAQARAQSHVALTAREDHYRGLSGGIASRVLEENDHVAAAFGVEARYPFFDRRLVEFCLALPPEQKLHQGWDRVILRRAMAQILPREVQWRGDKANLGPNFSHGLQHADRELLDEVIVNDSRRIKTYVDVRVLFALYRRYIDQRICNDELTIWRAVMLDQWLRRADPQAWTRRSCPDTLPRSEHEPHDRLRTVGDRLRSDVTERG